MKGLSPGKGDILRLHELTKKYELNFHNFKDHLKKLGYVGYGSPSKNIQDEDLEKLEELAEEFVATQEVLNVEKLAKRQGKFIGIVYDRKNGSFKSVVVKASYRELVEKGVEFEVLADHTTIFSALINMSKKIAKYINDRTVEKYGSAGE